MYFSGVNIDVRNILVEPSVDFSLFPVSIVRRKRIPALVYDTAIVDGALDREGLRQVADAAESVNI